MRILVFHGWHAIPTTATIGPSCKPPLFSAMAGTNVRWTSSTVWYTHTSGAATPISWNILGDTNHVILTGIGPASTYHLLYHPNPKEPIQMVVAPKYVFHSCGTEAFRSRTSSRWRGMTMQHEQRLSIIRFLFRGSGKGSLTHDFVEEGRSRTRRLSCTKEQRLNWVVIIGIQSAIYIGF